MFGDDEQVVFASFSFFLFLTPKMAMEACLLGLSIVRVLVVSLVGVCDCPKSSFAESTSPLQDTRISSSTSRDASGYSFCSFRSRDVVDIRNQAWDGCVMLCLAGVLCNADKTRMGWVLREGKKKI